MSAEEIVRAVIRGEKPLSALKACGLNVRSEVAWSVTADLSDIGAGVLFYSRRRGAKRWAELLLHAAYIELQPAADSPDWDALMGAIWDMSSGLAVSDQSAKVALRVSQTAKRTPSST